MKNNSQNLIMRDFAKDRVAPPFEYLKMRKQLLEELFFQLKISGFINKFFFKLMSRSFF